MADKLPMTREEMLDIEGVTEYKMETFGSHFLELTLAYAGAAIFTSEDNMISDGDDMMEAGRQDNEDDCASPYWAAAGINFTTSNGKSKKFRRKRNFNGKKKTKTRSKNNKTDAKKTDASSYNANNHISNPTVNKYRDFSKKRNLGSGRRLPGFLSIPAKK
ncbi:uncharacterized protein LOC114522671 [Dendronephthya gigantea]|uniref:uncharacterized protein LOC114522671 n=1 Tax=Dendronephthya gigantea TaxID=151771 RepID=UPI00106D36B7|nr:uncharacterized protein LOC114522671 [Dendronephthya gigantea]